MTGGGGTCRKIIIMTACFFFFVTVGALCEYNENSAAETLRQTCGSYADYFNAFNFTCRAGEPGRLVWTPNENTPDLVYYQVYNMACAMLLKFTSLLPSPLSLSLSLSLPSPSVLLISTWAMVSRSSTLVTQFHHLYSQQKCHRQPPSGRVSTWSLLS